MPGARFVRLIADPARGTLEERPIGGLFGELPDVRADRHGKPHRFVYLATPRSDGREPEPLAFPWFHGLAKVDVESGEAQVHDEGPDVFVGQPAFVPRGSGDAEDDGFVLSYVLDTRSGNAGAIVLDATDLTKGPIARLDLGKPLPGGSHAAFFPELWVG